MGRSGGPQRVTNVPHRSLGGEWRVRDSIILPIWLLNVLASFKWFVRRGKWTIPTTILLFLTINYSAKWHFTPLLSLILFFLLLFTYFSSIQLYKFLRLYRQHQNVPAKGVLRGLYYTQRIRIRWKDATRAAHLGHPTSHSWKPPKLKSLTIDSPYGTSIKARIDLGSTGNTTADLDKAADRILAIMDARSSQIGKLRPGLADFTIEWGKPRPISTEPWHQGNNSYQAPLLDLDIEQNGTALVDLGRSVLIGGETGGGKSNDLWVMLETLNRLQIPYELHVIDPVGGVELDELETSPFTKVYTDKASGADSVIRNFHAELGQRLEWMKSQHIRKHIPTKKRPFKICIIDELLVCTVLIKGGATGPLGDIVAVGRKAGFAVWACTQLGQKEVISHVRDLFPQRICHRTRTEELTDCILGTHATRDGADCTRLIHPGEGYIFTDTLRQFVKFQTPHIVHTRSVAQGGVHIPPDPLTRQKKNWRRKTDSDEATRGYYFTYLLFDSALTTQPCYVGISNNCNRRFKQHNDPNSDDFKVWFSTVIHQRTIIERYPSKHEAKVRETELIRQFSPKYNISERSDYAS